MKKMNLFFVGLFSTLVLLSCSNLDEPNLNVPNDSNITILGKSVVLENGTLSFENEESLNNILSEIEKTDSDQALKINGFRSMYDIYDEALEEAPLYYERNEGYQQFKEKYTALYFPEYGNDYAAYLPISNKNLAKLVNEEGKIQIAGKTVDCIDIASYEDLANLGLSDPDESVLTTRASKKEVFYRKSGSNKVWVNYTNHGRRSKVINLPWGGQTTEYYYYTHFEVCFRTKNGLGIWYNRKASTTIMIGYGNPCLACQEPSAGLSFYPHTLSNKNDRMSSHDYYIELPDIPNGSSLGCRISYGPWGLNNYYSGFFQL